MGDQLSIVHAPTSKVWSYGLKRQDCLELWKKLVVRYSNMLLTVPSDKLVAIGGVARIFAKALHCAYLAGLWRSNLIEQLLWETASSEAVRVDRYRGELCKIYP